MQSGESNAGKKKPEQKQKYISNMNNVYTNNNNEKNWLKRLIIMIWTPVPLQ